MADRRITRSSSVAPTGSGPRAVSPAVSAKAPGGRSKKGDSNAARSTVGSKKKNTYGSKGADVYAGGMSHGQTQKNMASAFTTGVSNTNNGNALSAGNLDQAANTLDFDFNR